MAWLIQDQEAGHGPVVLDEECMQSEVGGEVRWYPTQFMPLAACARCAATPPPASRRLAASPAPKKGASWILTPPSNLTARCPKLDATRTLIRQFADMLTHRQGSKPPAWADQTEASAAGITECRQSVMPRYPEDEPQDSHSGRPRPDLQASEVQSVFYS